MGGKLKGIESLLFFLFSFAIVFASAENLTAGWLWDAANAIGYAALAAICYVCFAKPKRDTLASHKSLSYIALGLVLGHLLILLVAEPDTLEYLSPGAPAHMWVALLVTVLLVFLVFGSSGSTKKQLHVSAVGFKFWHRLFSWLLVFGALYHIVASGLYINHPVQIFLLSILGLFALAPFNRIKISSPSSITFFALAVSFILLFTLARGLLL